MFTFPDELQLELSDGDDPICRSLFIASENVSLGVADPNPPVQPEFQWVSSRKLLKLWLFVLAGPADWRGRDVERLLSTRHSTRRYLFSK